MVTGTMTSTTDGGGRTIESKVSRAGQSVMIEMGNLYGDVVRASLNEHGGVTVIVTREGRKPELIRVPDRDIEKPVSSPPPSESASSDSAAREVGGRSISEK